MHKCIINCNFFTVAMQKLYNYYCPEFLINHYGNDMKNIFNINLLFSLLLILISPVLNATPVLSKAWETSGFQLPESVIYDIKNNILYVSNIKDDPFKKDGNGFISKVDPNGKVIELKWIEGLNAPKGLAISNDKLFISDIDQLVVADIATGKIINRYDAIGAAFLNDVAADSKGNIYVSDTFTDTIYRLNIFGQLTTWLYSPKLQAPNGLYIESDQLIVGGWGLPTDGWAADVVGHLKSVSLITKEIKSLGNGKAIGNLDGVESDANGAYYVTDWVAGKLLLIKPDGNHEVVLVLSQGTADHEVIHEKNLILVPNTVEGKLLAFEIK